MSNLNALVNMFIKRVEEGERRQVIPASEIKVIKRLRVYLNTASKKKPSARREKRLGDLRRKMRQSFDRWAHTKNIKHSLQKQGEIANADTRGCRARAISRLKKKLSSFKETRHIKDASVLIFLVEYILNIEKNYKWRGITPLKNWGIPAEMKATGKVTFTFKQLMRKWKSYIGKTAGRFSYGDWLLQEDLVQEGYMVLDKVYKKKKDVLDYASFESYFKGSLWRRFTDYVQKFWSSYEKLYKNPEVIEKYTTHHQKKNFIAVELSEEAKHLRQWVVEKGMEIAEYATTYNKSWQEIESLGLEVANALHEAAII